MSDDVISKEKKVNFAKALIPDMMPSEEEKEKKMVNDILSRKLLHFETKIFKSWLMLLIKLILKIV